MSYPPPGGQDPYQPLPPPEPESNPYAQAIPPPPAYQSYGQPMSAPPARGNNGLSIGSMITGIASLVFACCCAPLGVVGGGTAVVLGVIGLKQSGERGQAGRGMAIAGIATGGVAIAIAVVNFILGFTGALSDINNFDTSDWD